MTAKTAIRELLTEVSASTAPVTDSAIQDILRRIETLVILANEQDQLDSWLQSSETILAAIQDRNRGQGVTSGWKSDLQALCHSLETQGLVIKNIGETQVLVHAGVNAEYPVGGTPLQVLLRAIPANPEITLNTVLARLLREALGKDLQSYSIGTPVLLHAREERGTRVVALPRPELIKLLDALFRAGTQGWKARRQILSDYQITEA